MTFTQICKAAAVATIATAAPLSAATIQIDYSGTLEASNFVSNPTLEGATLNYSLFFDTDDGPTSARNLATQSNASYAGTANLNITGLPNGAADIIVEDMSLHMAIRNFYGGDDIWDIVEFSFGSSDFSVSNHQVFPGAFGTLDDFDEITFLTDGTIDPTLMTNTSLNHFGVESSFFGDSYTFASSAPTTGPSGPTGPTNPTGPTDPTITPVPLPSSAVLLLGALVGFAQLKRRTPRAA